MGEKTKWTKGEIPNPYSPKAMDWTETITDPNTELGRRYFLDLVFEIAEVVRNDLFTVKIAEAFVRRIENANLHRILTRKKAAHFLGISLRTLDRWVKEEGLPSEWRQVSPGKKPQRIFFLASTLEWQMSHLANSRATHKGDWE